VKQIEQFRAAIQAAGFDPPAAIEPGKLYRFSTNAKPADDAGWCKLFEDGRGGVFGDFRTGFFGSWQVKREKPFTPAEYERFKQKFAVWLVRTAYDKWANSSGIYALSTVCTHLGCTPNWLQAEQKFKCPCHGSGYYITGVNFEGPTPRPLERYAISLADDGQILVDKSRKFQQEKGEWINPAAFLKL